VHEHLADEIARDVERRTIVELAGKYDHLNSEPTGPLRKFTPWAPYRPEAYACDRPSASTGRRY
jgi:hypothetical protein